jgi:hypothetical protein
VFEAMSPKEFGAAISTVLQDLVTDLQGKVVAVDGKTMRGSFDRRRGKSALHVVSAWVPADTMDPDPRSDSLHPVRPIRLDRVDRTLKSCVPDSTVGDLIDRAHAGELLSHRADRQRLGVGRRRVARGNPSQSRIDLHVDVVGQWGPRDCFSALDSDGEGRHVLFLIRWWGTTGTAALLLAPKRRSELARLTLTP